MGKVGRTIGAADHAESHAVELVAFDDGGLGGVGVVRRKWVGIEIVLGAEPLVRNAAEGAALGEDVLPQLRWRARLGVHARHADDGNWSGHTLCLF